ncbi:hypothetical protein DPMN_064841 [Dreissena polymorpha]|uniref:Uncharacterized protein n=1 Tax=Dreissena polymorpha TaxID=45954 RepID=A0A9D4HKH3_DREPO|nr:hypothetical protein DPMN_064841 [Dreissena polymorpha]
MPCPFESVLVFIFCRSTGIKRSSRTERHKQSQCPFSACFPGLSTHCFPGPSSLQDQVKPLAAIQVPQVAKVLPIAAIQVPPPYAVKVPPYFEFQVLLSASLLFSNLKQL